MEVLSRETGAVRRVAVAEHLPAELGGYDYADAFELTLDPNDSRSAEELARVALDGAPSALRHLIHLVWRHGLKFEVGPSVSAQHVGGARITTSDPDLVHLHVGGPVMRGVIAGRRVEPDRFVVTTFVQYVRVGRAQAVWSLAAPLHRGIARYLLLRVGRRE